ncbi:uncharacterized protein LAESUDRAFT_729738 [Laetiporus sulphureus 93-53]|uniref:Uncharacterized protein n=1 Tax=Laetiporus sulphureus 93-53 TaxID=1314785 RepID=A0A165CGR3_9APHY|nr:uncharacterized protein LAESUDRAFT_729738 [Laetiporus sulphureus 93-53]KZT02777.1 hypothetical protein LAESUDRAFT_729738 [Laetiporus sulphureus 93-53]
MLRKVDSAEVGVDRASGAWAALIRAKLTSLYTRPLDSLEKISMTRRLIVTPLLICFMVVRHIGGDDQSREAQRFLLMCVQILLPCVLHPMINMSCTPESFDYIEPPDTKGG